MICGELDTFVYRWEVDERVEHTYPMETTSENLFLDVLGEVVPDDCELSWLDTFDSNGNIYDQSHEPNTNTEQGASLATAHSSE